MVNQYSPAVMSTAADSCWTLPYLRHGKASKPAKEGIQHKVTTSMYVVYCTKCIGLHVHNGTAEIRASLVWFEVSVDDAVAVDVLQSQHGLREVHTSHLQR